MWPYTNDEAGWLTPHEQPEHANRCSATDNDPAGHVSPRPAPDTLESARKPADET
jgi:hypothetical protein